MIIILIAKISLISTLMLYINFEKATAKCNLEKQQLEQINLPSEFTLDDYVAFDAYFDDLSEKARKKRLSFFAATLKERPDEIGYVISYAGKKAKKNESAENLKKIKAYLTKKEKVKLQQLVFIDGGYLEKGMTEFYIIPKTAPPPIPSSTSP